MNGKKIISQFHVVSNFDLVQYLLKFYTHNSESIDPESLIQSIGLICKKFFKKKLNSLDSSFK